MVGFKRGKVNIDLFVVVDKVLSSPVGTWMSGIPSVMDFEEGMEHEISMIKTSRVYKIVTVIQPPFMQWNETLRKKRSNYLHENHDNAFSTSIVFLVLTLTLCPFPIEVKSWGIHVPKYWHIKIFLISIHSH